MKGVATASPGHQTAKLQPPSPPHHGALPGPMGRILFSRRCADKTANPILTRKMGPPPSPLMGGGNWRLGGQRKRVYAPNQRRSAALTTELYRMGGWGCDPPTSSRIFVGCNFAVEFSFASAPKEFLFVVAGGGQCPLCPLRLCLLPGFENAEL